MILNGRDTVSVLVILYIQQKHFAIVFVKIINFFTCCSTKSDTIFYSQVCFNYKIIQKASQRKCSERF